MILEEILEREEGGRRIYGARRPDRDADFVPTLERLRDVRARAVAELLPELAEDILGYRVAEPSRSAPPSARTRS